MVLLLTGSIEGTKIQVHEYLETFTKYEMLWKGSKQNEYAAFMRTNPSLEAFEKELRKFLDIEVEIMHLPNRCLP